MKTIKILTQIGLLTTASLSMATQVNVNHLAPFADTAEGTAVSVNVNGNEVLTGVQFLQSSGYLELAAPGVAPGATTLEVFTPPGADTAAISATVDLAADTFYSVSAIGDGNNQPLSLLALEDSQSLPADGNIMIRVVHAAPFAAEIEATAASVRLDDGTVVNGLNNVTFGQESGFFELPAAIYDLKISTADGTTDLIDIAPVDLQAGTVVTVYATGDGSNQPVGAYAVFGDGTSSNLALETSEPTRVNVAHLAPFSDTLDGTSVAVNVNETEVLTGVTFRQASGYLTLADDGSAPGSTLLEVFAPPGSEAAAVQATVDLEAETDYTVAAIGDGVNQPLSLLPLVDNNSEPTTGHAKVRVVHAAPFASELADTAVSIRTDGGDLVNGLTGVEFGVASDYFELPAGSYDLNIATTDGSTRLIDLAPVTLHAGDVVTLFAIGEGVNQPLGIFAIFGDGSSADIALEQPFNTLNAGLNGSWFNQDTDGQGILIEVFPELGTMFIAWFTYDTTFPDTDETAVVGDSNHRWYTAQGEYDGTSANLNLYLSTGGIFDQDNVVTTEAAGTFSIDFDDCRQANVTYSIDGSGLTGQIPLTRISGSNVPLCESLNTSSAQ